MRFTTGPFEVRRTPAEPSRSHASSIKTSENPQSASDLAMLYAAALCTCRCAQQGLSITRDFDCPNYTVCLGTAAALNWDSFSCFGCCGQVDHQLLWRAHHNVRRDEVLADICRLPSLVELPSRKHLRSDEAQVRRSVNANR